MNRRESIGRIHDLPVSAGHLVDQGKERVAEQAQARHQTNMLEIEKAIPLGVVRYTYDDGADQARNHRRIHLTITVELPEGTVIDTADYRYEHGCPPANAFGVWGFIPQDGDGEHIELGGELLDVIERLPEGEWSLMA